jgi:hypothetical protein
MAAKKNKKPAKQLYKRYVIKYSCLGKRMGFDCANEADATYHMADLSGYEEVTDLRIDVELVEILELRKSPYEIQQGAT